MRIAPLIIGQLGVSVATGMYSLVLTVEHVHVRVIDSGVVLKADLCTPIQVDPVPHQRIANAIPATKSVL